MKCLKVSNKTNYQTNGYLNRVESSDRILDYVDCLFLAFLMIIRRFKKTKSVYLVALSVHNVNKTKLENVHGR